MKGKLEAKPISGEQEKRVNAWLAKHAPKEWKAISARMQIAEPTEDDRKALEASIAARAAEGEWEEVPYEDWNIGDEIERAEPDAAGVFVVGLRYKILALKPTRSGTAGVLIEHVDAADNVFGWAAQFFRLRRRKTAEFVWHPKWAIAGTEVRIKRKNGGVMDAVIENVSPWRFIVAGYSFDSDGKARIGPDVCAEIIGLIAPF
jgi:hypothetical protein